MTEFTFDKEIIIGEGENALNVTAVLEKIINFILTILNFEFPEVGEIINK